MRQSNKLHRWTDLLASLLLRKFPASFEEIAKDVPAYTIEGDTDKASVMRAFERDKQELRDFGIPIETVTNDLGETIGYKLSSKEFYLPYLCLLNSGAQASRPKKVDKFGYQALTSLNFSPDELAVLSQAAARVRDLGDPLLREDSNSAIRKLAFDLPIGIAAQTDKGIERVPTRSVIPDAVFEKLNHSLLRKKRVTFNYTSAHSGAADTREVEPYGLFFVSSHWYLAARDVARDSNRTFRVSRISDPKVNAKGPQTADFVVPADFKLREYAASKQAWELGDGDYVEAVVQFELVTGETLHAADLGAQSAKSNQRIYKVRRLDVFARWLLSFAGRAVPVEPAALVAEYRNQATATAALYAGGRND